MASGRVLLNHNFKGRPSPCVIMMPFIHSTCCELGLEVVFDPTFSVINWMCFTLGLIHSRIIGSAEPNLADPVISSTFGAVAV